MLPYHQSFIAKFEPRKNQLFVGLIPSAGLRSCSSPVGLSQQQQQQHHHQQQQRCAGPLDHEPRARVRMRTADGLARVAFALAHCFVAPTAIGCHINRPLSSLTILVPNAVERRPAARRALLLFLLLGSAVGPGQQSNTTTAPQPHSLNTTS